MEADRAGIDIEIANGDDSLPGYLATPESGRGPGVLVIQEWWGLVPHIRDVCDRLAREGFVALAPDLYHGRATDDPDEAGRYMLGLEIPRALRDLDAAVDELLSRDTVGAKVGVVGFCMGGQLALAAGCENARVGAVADFYGVHPDVRLNLANCRAPVLAVFAKNDAFIPAAAVRKLSEEMEAAGVRASVRTIEGAQHAFMNDTRPDVYDATAAAAGWAALLGLFRAELG